MILVGINLQYHWICTMGRYQGAHNWCYGAISNGLKKHFSYTIICDVSCPLIFTGEHDTQITAAEYETIIRNGDNYITKAFVLYTTSTCMSMTTSHLLLLTVKSVNTRFFIVYLLSSDENLVFVKHSQVLLLILCVYPVSLGIWWLCVL